MSDFYRRVFVFLAIFNVAFGERKRRAIDIVPYFLLLTKGTLKVYEDIYGTDPSVPDLMPSANPKSARLSNSEISRQTTIKQAT